ncbi:MAG: hypothetical protein PSV26_11360 [Polaromonas sp.]|uniref:hypothetical protein n=1 Tax=Polaromonas sp. TaxID=1869339 RepID=UPI0024885520|nr:hypothetical protein [Polaromonas sp.]MDI1238070.1 hypothetical protein [Polaromonas sp.]
MSAKNVRTPRVSAFFEFMVSEIDRCAPSSPVEPRLPVKAAPHYYAFDSCLRPPYKG